MRMAHFCSFSSLSILKPQSRMPNCKWGRTKEFYINLNIFVGKNLRLIMPILNSVTHLKGSLFVFKLGMRFHISRCR